MYILVLKYLIWIPKVVLFKISLLSSNRPARTGPSPAIVEPVLQELTPDQLAVAISRLSSEQKDTLMSNKVFD